MRWLTQTSVALRKPLRHNAASFPLRALPSVTPRCTRPYLREMLLPTSSHSKSDVGFVSTRQQQQQRLPNILQFGIYCKLLPNCNIWEQQQQQQARGPTLSKRSERALAWNLVTPLIAGYASTWIVELFISACSVQDACHERFWWQIRVGGETGCRLAHHRADVSQGCSAGVVEVR